MIMKGPGLEPGKRIKGFTQSCDVAPTVIDWLGLPAHFEMQGKSLLPLATGEVEKVRDFAIAGYHRYSASIITEDWSYINYLRPDEKTIAEMKDGFYRVDAMKTMGHLGGKVMGESVGDVEKRLKEREAIMTLDGEDQWTCTPGSIADLPDTDEMFDRKADPFQLNNIIKKDKKRAEELYDQIREFMGQVITDCV
jgi:hypothetical protein